MTEDDLRRPEIDSILQHAAMVMDMPVSAMRWAVLNVLEVENCTAKFLQPRVTQTMLARSQVYERISTRAVHFKNYFGKDEGGVIGPPLPASLEDWLNLMRAGVYRGLTGYNEHGRLDNYLSLAAKCVLCMEAHGYVTRRGGCEIVHGNRNQVFLAVNAEVDFTPRHSIEGYVLLVDHYLRAAIDNWACSTNQSCTLISMRMLAAVCVRCLEEHGE